VYSTVLRNVKKAEGLPEGGCKVSKGGRWGLRAADKDIRESRDGSDRGGQSACDAQSTLVEE